MPDALSVALATFERLPDLNDDDRRLLHALRARGVDAEPARWDVARDWSRHDAVLIRTCWDYYHHLDRFLAWIDEVEDAGARLLNPAPLVRWNADKRYLRELEALGERGGHAGVRLVPTAWVDGGAAHPPLAELLAERGWKDAVVKPAVSAGAFETWRVSVRTAAQDEARFAALVRRPGAVLVQPFVPEVVEGGEWSLVFIAGEYSHAVVKRPAPADFRVQVEHGGSYAPATPSAPLVEDAAAVLGAAAARTGIAPEDVLYARVDGVARDGRLMLMELECIEPFLFLGAEARAAERMADALTAAMSYEL